MKVPLPLSLKFSLWLLLNLLLLGTVGACFLVAEGGLGWDSLVRTAAGRRVQELGNVIVGEFTAADGAGDARRGVLDRFGATYGVKFYLIHPSLPGASSPRDGLPTEVAVRVEEAPPDARDRPARPGPGGPPDDFGPPARRDGPPPVRDGPPPVGDRGPKAGPRQPDPMRGRFLVHAGEPVAFWLGVRVPIDRPAPVTLVARIDSWWSLMRLLDLQPWLLAGGAIVVFSVLFWLPFVRGITHALGQLTAATGRIAEGKFDTRVPAARRDELGQLGTSVNQMAARLDTLVNGQKRFLADIAHELGSPVGRLQVAVEILETRADPALQAQVADVREEIQQMSALVGELLAFTRAGLRPRDAELASVELAPLVAQTLAREAAGTRAVADVPAGLAARADAPLLSRAIGNLVRNALRYSSDAGPITVTARRVDHGVAVTVEDHGPGVPPEALARLGEPFYRPDNARARETGGVGLGLAIVRTSVAACGGAVRFTNRDPHGFVAEITLAEG